MVDDEICYISCASPDFPQRICFAFLDDIKSEYVANYQGKNKNHEYQRFLIERMVGIFILIQIVHNLT